MPTLKRTAKAKGPLGRLELCPRPRSFRESRGTYFTVVALGQSTSLRSDSRGAQPSAFQSIRCGALMFLRYTHIICPAGRLIGRR